MSKDKIAPPAPKSNKPAPAAASAAPGTKDEAGKKAPKRKAYAAPEGAEWVNEKGEFTRMPDDYDSKLHLPIKRKQFADEGVFFLVRADELEARAAKYRVMAEEAKKLGGMKEKGKAKRLLQLQKKFAELKEQLAGTGIDVDALLAGAPLADNAAE